VTQDWTAPPDAYLAGEAVMRRELRIPFQGWRLVGLHRLCQRPRAGERRPRARDHGLSHPACWAFWLNSRKTRNRLVTTQRESAELRLLNARLQREIAERERMEKSSESPSRRWRNPPSSPVLGEMSAAVSHELNQPLAAMKTYLAGARLLVQRKRHDEALASFQRIDDLIDRHGRDHPTAQELCAARARTPSSPSTCATRSPRRSP
jgi:two-component system C4-dicarboxylate transport sensor histidine kinase DctB